MGRVGGWARGVGSFKGIHAHLGIVVGGYISKHEERLSIIHLTFIHSLVGWYTKREREVAIIFPPSVPHTLYLLPFFSSVFSPRFLLLLLKLKIISLNLDTFNSPRAIHPL